MERKLYDNYLAILKSELMVALGCTEPIAIAYAAARARETLGSEPAECVVLQWKYCQERDGRDGPEFRGDARDRRSGCAGCRRWGCIA